MSVQPAVTANHLSLSALQLQLDAIPNHLYVRTPANTGFSIGEQVRRILDHYLMLLRGLESGNVCYDKRERSQLLESSLPAAQSALSGVLGKLQTLQERQDQPLNLTCAISNHSSESAQTISTLVRELLFVHSHTVHHMAIISMMLRAESVAVPDDFGVAPATLQFRHHTST